MFGIKVKNEFLDLGQSSFDIILKSPFYFDNGDSDVLKGSVLLSFKAPLTKKNKRVLGSPQSLPNPNFFLENVSEVWSNGSQLYEGPFKVMESTGNEATISVSINSFSNVRDLFLNELNLFKTAIEPLQSDVVLNPENYQYRLPSIWNPSQDGNPLVYEQEYTLEKGMLNFTPTSIDPFDQYENRPTPKHAPMVLLTHIWENIFKKMNKRVLPLFSTHAELKEMILYYANTGLNNGRRRTRERSEFDLREHVPKKIRVGDFVKNTCRFFNVGLEVENLNQEYGFIKAHDALDNDTNVLNWTNKVLKEYVVKQIVTPTNRYFRKHTDYSDYWKDEGEKIRYNPTPIFQYTTTTKPGYYINAGQEHFVRAKSFPDLAGTLYQRGFHYINHQDEVNIPQEFKKTEFEFKVMTLPMQWVHFVYQRSIGMMPHTQQLNNDIEGSKEDELTYLLYRGIDRYGTPLASAEAEYLNIATGSTLGITQPVRLGKFTTLPDQRPIAKYALTIEGEKGIFNKFHKNWAAFIDKKREVEFNLNLSIKDLRDFTFSKNVYIGNSLYLVRELHVKFGVNGIESAKATMVQL
jgi:hypothetical protein